jgi:hypothetical protein
VAWAPLPHLSYTRIGLRPLLQSIRATCGSKMPALPGVDRYPWAALGERKCRGLLRPADLR